MPNKATELRARIVYLIAGFDLRKLETIARVADALDRGESALCPATTLPNGRGSRCKRPAGHNGPHGTIFPEDFPEPRGSEGTPPRCCEE